jgi:hypothetical protein
MLERVITSANLGVGDDQSAVIQNFGRYPSVQRITTHRMRAFLVLVRGDDAVLVIDDTACGPVECKSSLPISAVVLVGTNPGGGVIEGEPDGIEYSAWSACNCRSSPSYGYVLSSQGHRVHDVGE